MLKFISQQKKVFSYLNPSLVSEGAGHKESNETLKKSELLQAAEAVAKYENDRAYKISVDNSNVEFSKMQKLKALIAAQNEKSVIDAINIIKDYQKNGQQVANDAKKWKEFHNAKNLLNGINEEPKTSENLKKTSESLKTKSIDDVKNQFDLATAKITKKIDDGKSLNDEESQKLKDAISLAEKQLIEIENKSSKKDEDHKEIISKASSLRHELAKFKQQEKTETKTESKAKKEYQDENTSMKDREFSGVFSSYSRSEYINGLDSESKVSLDKILQSKDFLKIQQEIYKELYSGKYKNSEGGVSLTPVNNGKLADILRSHGYKFSDIWKSKEIMSVALELQDYAETQKNIPNLSSKEKMKLLLDFDNDGKITKKLNFSVGESQSSNLLSDEEKINNILENLGFGNMQNFSKSMTENLALSKERFKRQLGSMIESRVSLAELSVKNGVNKAFNDIYKDDLDLSLDIGAEIDNSKKLDEKLNTLSLSEEQKEAFKKVLKLEAVGGIVGGKTGAGATFDIKNYTKNIIDSVGVGMVGGTPGITFTKGVYDKHGVKASVGLANVVVPMASLSYTLERKPELKKLFDKQIDSKFQPTLYAGITTLGSAVGFNVERLSQDTKNGVDKMVGAMHTKLQTIKGDLLAGNTFENSKFAKNSSDKVADEVVYNDMLNAFRPLIGTSVSDKALNSMLVGYEQYYKNYLFQNAEGLHITSAGAGVALVAGFLPTPYLTIGGEYNSVELKTIKDRLESQRKNTTELISADKLGLGFEKIDGKNVYSIVDNGNVEFSSPTGEVEVKRENGKIYFSGNINSISATGSFEQNFKTNYVVINGGKTQKNGEFIVAKETPIKTNITKDILHTATVEHKELNDLNKDALEKSKLARNDLFNIIDETAPKSGNTPGLQKLQNAIFILSTHEKSGNLNEVWSKFKDLINNPKFDLYAKSTNSTQNLTELREIIPTIENNSEVKMMILTSLSQTLMKKGSLKNHNGEIQVGESLTKHEGWNENDKVGNRDIFFNGVFNKSTPDLSASLITARTEWFAHNGNKTEYNFVDASNSNLEGSIAFSATETKLGKKGLIPFTGAYHIADAGVKEIEIPQKSSDLIKLIPESYLNTIKNNLEKGNNLKLNSIQEVRDLLNGKEINGVKMDYKLSYVKMGECLNEAIVLKALKIYSSKTIVNNVEYSSQTSTNAQKDNTVKFGLVGAGEKQKKHEEHKDETPENDKTNPETKPDGEPTGTSSGNGEAKNPTSSTDQNTQNTQTETINNGSSSVTNTVTPSGTTNTETATQPTGNAD